MCGELYELIAQQNGVSWRGRNYGPANFEGGDIPNRCLSAATACLYGLTEAAILAAGYAPAIGFLHTGQPLSFVYDIADLFKFETVVPVAMQVEVAWLKASFWMKQLRREAQDLKEVVAEQALESRLLKKSMIADGGRPNMKLPASEKLEIIYIVEQSHLPARRTLEMRGIKPSTFYR